MRLRAVPVKWQRQYGGQRVKKEDAQPDSSRLPAGSIGEKIGQDVFSIFGPRTPEVGIFMVP